MSRIPLEATLQKVRNGLNYSISPSLAVLLIASMLVIPLCISPLYLRTVSAEEFSNSTLANSTSLVTNSTSLVTNSTSLVTNSTSLVTNSTSLVTNSTLTKSTLVNPTLANFTVPGANSTLANSTALVTHSTLANFTVPYANSTLANSTPLVATSISAHSINGTSSYQNNTNNKNPILNSTILWEFKSLKKSTAQGDVKVENITNKNSLTLSGSGFLQETVSSTKNLSDLTLSVWIKPDYSQGSPQFTAISKENSFNLAVNNHIPPTRVVVFSVFDGITWHSVNSTVQIPEEWTQIVGTFNGKQIGIYVNGNKESTSAISGVPTISVNGKLETKTVNTISSNADIVIGAYLNSVRGNPYNLFSGSLEDAKIYDSLLSDSQISELYHQNIHSNNQTTTTPS